MRRVKTTVIAALVCALASGCNKKVPECNALIKQLNDTGTVMEQVTSALGTSKRDKADLDKVAAAIDTEMGKLGKVELTVPELSTFSKTYQALLRENATATRALGKVAGEIAGIQNAVNQGQSAFVAATAQLETACLKARKECSALGEKLTRAPGITGVRHGEDAKKLKEYARGIGAVDAKHPEVKAATERLERTVGEFASALEKSGTLQEGSEQAMKTLNEINAKEPALVKSINDFCQGS